MSDVKIIFSLDGIDSLVQCTKEEKLKDICLKYATKLDKKLSSLLFLYVGKPIDFDLNFTQLANQEDKIRNEMKISVYKNESNGFISPAYDKEKINEILVSNNNIRNTLNEMNSMIENIIKNSTTNSINNDLKNINTQLKIINEQIKINNEKLKNINVNENSEIQEKNEIKTKSQTLLENIKADYFIQKLFSNLDEKIKLKTLKYSKNLQRKANINLTNYKVFSGRYIIYESNGKAREYLSDNDYLIFKGEYLNGKRNGKGKEYKNGKEIIFIGEYLDGKRSGKGKEYNSLGNLEFEGEYLNGERNGKGREYNHFGDKNFKCIS